MRKSLMAGGSAFAHLAPGAAMAKKPDDEDAAAAAAAPDPEDPDAAAADADPDDADDKKKNKKAKKRGEKPEDGEQTAEVSEDDTEKASVAGANRERARGNTIFGCAAAGLRPDVAAFVAFRTDLPAATAVNLLNVVVAGEPKGMSLVTADGEPFTANVTVLKPDLRARMAAEPSHDVGTDVTEAAKGVNLAAQIILAGKKRRGEAA